MNKLLQGMQKEYNYTYTENNALTYKTTFSNVLDLFYHAPAKRGQDNTALFENAYNENALLALKTMFYIRDVRGGQGERETFRQALKWLSVNDRRAFESIVALVPDYGRWDDILEFVDNGLVQSIVKHQLYSDQMSNNPSLLAKWMPSANTSSKETVKLAHRWINALGIPERQYRKMLSTLRAKINIVERQMSSGAFSDINYEHVPSRASTLYRKAFSKRDAERYVAYLEAVKKGEKKINAATTYPYELIAGYINDRYVHSKIQVDTTLEEQWKALPNYADSDENALVVVDVSGSMFSSESKPLPITVSVSLGIYIAERNKGAFKNNFITFTSSPALITLRGRTLAAKVTEVFTADVGYDTNFQAVFNMLLDVAIRNRVPQAEMPTKIFVISDMEFNQVDNSSRRGGTNFEAIKRKYAQAGYEMPTLIFWNVASRNMQAPVTMDENGVYLVAGASPSIFKNAINARATNPFDMLLEVINSERYAAVEEAVKGL